MTKIKNYRVPNWTAGEMTPAHGQMVLQYMKDRCLANKTADAPTVVAYTHGATVVLDGYRSGVLNKEGTRIYLIPYSQATATVWHYIDVSSAAVVPYTHGATVLNYGYNGGCLAPNGRIYLSPNAQSTATVWHYIDTDGTVVAYTHGVTCVKYAYGGAILQPNTGRIYLSPLAQATATVWHYINTTDGTVVAYTHGATCLANAYGSGCLAPNGKIFLNPESMYNQATWHYIDSDGSVVDYTHAVNNTYWYGSNLGFDGMIYACRALKRFNPMTNEITSITGDYISNYGGAMASDGRIYLAPFVAATTTVWTYIDIATNNAVSYSHGSTVVDNSYLGAIYANGRVYLIPWNQSTAAVWHYIQTNNTNPISKNVLTSPYFNKL